MKTKFSLKILPAAILLTAPWIAHASLDALTVQSKLGEPFSASVSLSGDEAQTALSNPGSVSISGAPHLKARVIQRNNATVIIINGSTAVRDPITSFTVKVGSSSRRYSALIDPPAVPSTPVTAKTPQKIPPAQITTPETEGRVASGDIRLGQKYTTQAEDTVISIARRIKTPDATLGQTMRAIIAKNPHAFRNGNPNLLISGTTIRIPTAEELARPAAVHTTEKPVHTTKPKTVGQKTAPSTTPPATPPATPPVEPEKVEKPVTETPPTPPASEPLNTTIPETASEVASETIPDTSETIPGASETVTASEPEVSEIIVPPTEPPPPEDTPPPPPPVKESGINWMAWLPYIGGGLLLLLLLALLLSRRGKNTTKASKTQRKEFIPTSDEFDIPPPAAHPAPVISAPAHSAPPIPAAVTQHTPETFDDDDITFDTAPPVFSAKTATPPPAPIAPHSMERDIPVLTDAASDDDFMLDLPDLDLSKEEKTTSFMGAESFIDETPAKAAPQPQQPDPDQSFDFQVVDFEDTPSALSVPVTEHKPVTDHQEDDFSFDFDTETSPPQLTQAEVPQLAETNLSQFMDEEVVAPRRAPSVEDQLAEGEKQKLAFDPSIGLDLALSDEPVKPATQQHTATDFAFDLDEVAETVAPVSAPPTPEPSYEIDFEPMPTAPSAPISEPEITFDLTTATTDSTIEFEPIPATPAAPAFEPEMTFDITTEAEAIAPVREVVTAPSLHEAAIEFDLAEPVLEKTVSASAPAAQAIPSATPTPVHVGDDAPLQAKLELAKMYLSMDDTEGAVETLYDLMDNCEEGDAVYREAEALLSTLPQA